MAKIRNLPFHVARTAGNSEPSDARKAANTTSIRVSSKRLCNGVQGVPPNAVADPQGALPFAMDDDPAADVNASLRQFLGGQARGHVHHFHSQ